MLTFNVEQIKHLGNPHHFIISVAGMPFYQSLGTNSGFPGTWFPFFGVMEENGSGLNKGDYIKPIKTKLGEELINVVQNAEVARRFWKLPCLWISAELGGGYWSTSEGIRLKKFLDRHYFNLFPDIFPKLQLLSVEREMSDIQAINTWLGRCANLNTIDFPTIFPETLLDLGAQLDQNKKTSTLRL